jgi:hypothetical protein
MADENDHPGSQELESREPTLADLRSLCRELNHRQARYVVVGGYTRYEVVFERNYREPVLLYSMQSTNLPKIDWH